ncbi:unnamed protein product [Arctogadus glacialis]
MGLCPKRLPAACPQAVSDALVDKDRAMCKVQRGAGEAAGQASGREKTEGMGEAGVAVETQGDVLDGWIHRRMGIG